MTYDIGNSSPGLGQVHKCVGVKPVNEIPTIPLLIIGSSMIQTNNKKNCTDLPPHKKTTYYHKNEWHKHGQKQGEWTLVVNWLLDNKVDYVG